MSEKNFLFPADIAAYRDMVHKVTHRLNDELKEPRIIVCRKVDCRFFERKENGIMLGSKKEDYNVCL